VGRGSLTSMTRPFRFAVNLIAPRAGPDWTARCREAEGLGYDVLRTPLAAA